PAGPIHDLAGAFSDPIALQRGVAATIEHPVAGRLQQVAPPWRLDGEPFTIGRRPPLLGEHTIEVLREVAGYGAAEAAALTHARE
ncbi:MAG: CoA transferase, partial [Candidatus Dormiibacterota bacterium]